MILFRRSILDYVSLLVHILIHVLESYRLGTDELCYIQQAQRECTYINLTSKVE